MAVLLLLLWLWFPLYNGDMDALAYDVVKLPYRLISGCAVIPSTIKNTQLVQLGKTVPVMVTIRSMVTA
jgi:hypothetical protein